MTLALLALLPGCAPVFLAPCTAGVDYVLVPDRAVEVGVTGGVLAGDAERLLGAHAEVSGGPHRATARVGLDYGFALDESRVVPIVLFGPEVGLALVSLRPEELLLADATLLVPAWSGSDAFAFVSVNLSAGLEGRSGYASAGLAIGFGGGGRDLGGDPKPPPRLDPGR